MMYLFQYILKNFIRLISFSLLFLFSLIFFLLNIYIYSTNIKYLSVDALMAFSENKKKEKTFRFLIYEGLGVTGYGWWWCQ
jgi:hypothetical protein